MSPPKKLLRISPLHTKGLLMLVLVFLSESVTVSNAVNEWSSIKQRLSNRFSANGDNGGRSRFSPNTEDVADGGSGDPSTCPSSAPILSAIGRVLPIGRGNRRSKQFPDDCCSDCLHCMDDGDAESVCQVSRGGHVVDTASTIAEGSGVVKTPYGIPLHLWKVIFQAFLTTLNVLCWLIPLKSKQISDNKLALSLANAFSGGVFLSLAFGHLIPECVHGFDASFPAETPYLLVLVGYLVIFFVEKVAFDPHEIMHEMEHADEKRKAKEDGAPNGEAPQASSGRSALILLGALGVHSVLEMMALGLSSSFGDSALLTMSIALHQPAESIALLVAFLKSGMPKDQILQFLSVFSCMGPIGVALGMAVSEYASPVVDSAMLAIVAGTFVYVGATEVIPEEWEDSTHKWKKFAALMSGICTIIVITQYTATLGS